MVKLVAIANLSSILATCARVNVWYGIKASVVLNEVIHISYIQLIASINSGLFVRVSFHAIISRLIELQDYVTLFHVEAVIPLESGFVLSIFGVIS